MTWIMTLGEWSFVRNAGLNRTTTLYTVVMGTCWGLGNYFMAHGGPHPGLGDIFTATEPTGTK